MERVSVILPTYNRAHLVKRAIDSVLPNLEAGDELIVVDDGSTDDTEAQLVSFGNRIRYFRRPHRGAGATRNFGLDQARLPLISFIDSDDEWLPQGLAIKRRLMAASPELVFCFTDFANTDDNTHINHKFLVQWHRDRRSWKEILGPGVAFSTIATLPPGWNDFDVHVGDMYAPLLERPYVPAWTSLVRRELAGSDLRFAEDLQTAEDWLCFGQVARHGPAAFLDCETALNHGHTGPRLTSDAGFIGLADAHLQLAERVWGTDEDFLRDHADLYDRTVASIHVQRARWYLGHGMARQARSDLEAAGGAAPRSLRLLAHAPSWLLAVVADLRKLVLHFIGLGE